MDEVDYVDGVDQWTGYLPTQLRYWYYGTSVNLPRGCKWIAKG